MWMSCKYCSSNAINSGTIKVDFNDTKTIFEGTSTMELINTLLLFQMCSSPNLVSIMIKLTNKALENTQKKGTFTDKILNVISSPIVYIVKKQYFPLFTGGETINDCIRLTNKYLDKNLRLIIDNSTEEALNIDMINNNVRLKEELINISYKNLRSGVKFLAIKMTAFIYGNILEKMTIHINKNGGIIPDDVTTILSEQDKHDLDDGLNKLSGIIELAISKGFGIWLDAEQFDRQPAMNYISRVLQQRFNTDDTIWIYNTYQMYLKNSPEWLENDLEYARQNGFKYGVKLVRGAYDQSERAKAAKEGYPDPIQDTKELTDKSYNNNVNKMIKLISESNNNGVAICTHNRESLINAANIMNKYNINNKNDRIYTAQLRGMCDNLSFVLGINGYNSLKLLPYGSFDDVWPFLSRRLLENMSILGGMSNEKKYYYKEINRRLFG